MIPFLAAIVAALIGIAGYFLYSDPKASASNAAGTVAPAPAPKPEAATASSGQAAAASVLSGPQQGATAATKAPPKGASQGMRPDIPH